MRIQQQRWSGLWLVAALGVVVGLASCSWLKKDDPANTVDGGTGSPCTGHSECSTGFICAGGACHLEGSIGLGGPCWASRDCTSGLYCSPAGVCAPAGTGTVGDPCVTGGECSSDLVCVLHGFGGSCQAAGTSDLGDTCASSTDCIPGLACAADKTCQAPSVAYPPFEGVACEPDETPFRAFFELPRAGTEPRDFFRLPFPNDARVNDAGQVDMSGFPRPGPTVLGIDLVGLYLDAFIADFDGFSSVAAVTFRFSAPLNFDSLGQNGANVHYIDITDPGAPEFGSDRSRRYGFTSARGKLICQNTLTVANVPHEPLLPNHTYAVYVSSSITSTNGDAAIRDPDLVAALGAARPADPAAAQAWDRYANFRTFMANQSLAVEDLAAVTVFTVRDTVGRAARLHTATLAEPLPVLSDLTLCDGTNVSPCDDGGARVCGTPNADFYEVHGRYRVPKFQQGTSPFDLPAQGGGITETAGVPNKDGDYDVCFALTIPKAATAPVGGWPMVVYAHGTGGTFKGAVNSGVARQLATASTPMAMFSYDGVVHGERRGASTRDEDSLMFNVVNPRAARDNNLQGAVDVWQALRIADVSTFTVTGVGDVSFDAGKRYYFGHSQGSNVGIPAIAATDLTNGAIFSGAGSYLSDGILSKTSPVNAKAGLELVLGEAIDGAHPMMTLWQTFFDDVDPVNHAPLLLRRPPPGIPSKNIYLSWGLGDTYSPPATLTHTARATGLRVASPVVQDLQTGTEVRPIAANVAGGDGVTRTAACFQYQPSGYDGHFVATQNPTAQADWLAFLTSLAATGTATVP